MRPIVPPPPPTTYNVYEVPRPRTAATPSGGPVPPAGREMPVPLNAQPVASPGFEDPHVEFGEERCYVVRAITQEGAMTAESDASPPTCVTPVDTFPPAAPRSLAAVASPGVISLIWEPNSDKDLAGYLVFRGEAGGAALERVTRDPIHETTYRDTTVTPGVRYVYAVRAVDKATPPNVSGESNRVEETAR